MHQPERRSLAPGWKPAFSKREAKENADFLSHALNVELWSNRCRYGEPCPKRSDALVLFPVLAKEKPFVPQGEIAPHPADGVFFSLISRCRQEGMCGCVCVGVR
jgi:hypothetical protein